MTTERATCWSVTINNPTQIDDDCIAEAKARSGWKVVGQLEKGENGTEHYQMMVSTPQVRFSSIKKAFPRAHIEVAKNPALLAKYVLKEDTRAGKLPTNDMYPSQASFYNLIIVELEDDAAPKKKPVTKERVDYITQQVQRTGQVRSSSEPLDRLDWATKRLISRGYHVEHHACNPQVRSAWKGYADAMISRFRLEQAQAEEAKLAAEKISAFNIIHDADDDSVQGNEDAGEEQAESVECSDDEEASSQGSAEESGSDTCSEASDQSCD